MNEEDTALNEGLSQTAVIEGKDFDDDIEADLSSMEGVRSVNVEDNRLVVEFDPTVVDENQIRAAAQNGGAAPNVNNGNGDGLVGDAVPFGADEVNRNG